MQKEKKKKLILQIVSWKYYLPDHLLVISQTELLTENNRLIKAHVKTYAVDFTLDVLRHLLSSLSRKSVVSVPYSLLMEQPYTPQSLLDARTIARATWFSSPPLG